MQRVPPHEKKYKKTSTVEDLGTAKQQSTAWSVGLRRYTREAEARRLNGLFATGPSKVYYQICPKLRLSNTERHITLQRC